MNMSLEGAAKPGTVQQGSHDYRQPQGHQERWLFELEQAMLAQGIKKAALEGAATPNTDVLEPAAATGSAPVAVSVASAVISPVAAAVVATPPAVLSPFAAAMVVPAGVVALYAPYSEGTVVAVPLAVINATRATTSPVLPNAETVEHPHPAMALPAYPVVTPSGQSAARGEMPWRDAETAGASAAHAAREDSLQDYAARQMHMYRGSDGVSAWIRDATLGDPQARLVAQAMVLELGGAGVRLKAVTVNGKQLSTGQQEQAHVDYLVDHQASGEAIYQFMKKEAI